MVLGCRLNSNFHYKYDENGLTYRNLLKYDGQILLNGLYYTRHSNGGYGVYLFFNDGYVCSFSCQSLDSVCINIDWTRRVPYFWGVYIIENDTLKIQQVNSNAGIFEKFKIYEETARIINDTTIYLMYKKYSEEKTRQHQMNQIYRFMPLENMPSSQNILMECKKCN
jgi:hypothetical protein